MSIQLSEQNHETLNDYLDTILEKHKAGEIDTLSARSEIAHVVAAAAQDNPGTMRHVDTFLKEHKSRS